MLKKDERFTRPEENGPLDKFRCVFSDYFENFLNENGCCNDDDEVRLTKLFEVADKMMYHLFYVIHYYIPWNKRTWNDNTYLINFEHMLRDYYHKIFDPTGEYFWMHFDIMNDEMKGRPNYLLDFGEKEDVIFITPMLGVKKKQHIPG